MGRGERNDYKTKTKDFPSCATRDVHTEDRDRVGVADLGDVQ